MHAYLFLNSNAKIEDNISFRSLTEDHRIMEFVTQKVSDIKELRNFLKIKYSEKICVLIKNFDEASNEAQNAMLKILEEPQENVMFILTASFEDGILPTILDRCEVVKIKKSEKDRDELELNQASEFYKMNKAEKMIFVKNLRKREEVVEFLSNYCFLLSKIIPNDKIKAKHLEQALATLKNIQANGNNQIQLTRMVLGL